MGVYYVVVKGGMLMLMKVFVCDFVVYGVIVNVILLGLFDLLIVYESVVFEKLC